MPLAKELPIPKNHEFLSHFHVQDLFMDKCLSERAGHYILNIATLSKWLEIAHGYESENHDSMKDFIEKNFGETATGFIEGLLFYDSSLFRVTNLQSFYGITSYPENYGAPAQNPQGRALRMFAALLALTPLYLYTVLN
jgi:hypothetical protein